MDLIKTIKDEQKPDESEYKLRECSRAVLFDKENKIPLLHVSKYGYYKLPGGGIEQGESKRKALIRECLEETGSKINILGKIGKVIEFRSQWNLKQVSYCYYGNIVSKGQPQFTPKEKNRGMELKWCYLGKAIQKIRDHTPEKYSTFFVKQRDLSLLKKMEEIKKQN